jgi:hypothetical protein
VQVRPFIERWPHSASAGEGGAADLAAWAFAGRTADLVGVESAVDASCLSRYRASRIARIAASLLIV